MKSSPMESSNQTKISNLQFWMMITAFVTPFGHFVYINIAFMVSGRDAWISLLAAASIVSFYAYLHFRTASHFPGKSLVQYTETIWGKWIGKVISVGYILFILLACVISAHVLAKFVEILLPKTPVLAIMLPLVLLIAWLVYLGIEAIARIVQVLLPLMMLLGILASTLTLGDKHLRNLLPVLEHGLYPVWNGCLIFLVMFADMIVFGLITQHTKEPAKLPRQSLLSIALLAFMFIGPVTGPFLIFDGQLPVKMLYPTYEEIKYIEIADFLQNLDLIGLFLWSIGSFMRLSVFFYGATIGIADLFRVKNESKVVVLVFLMIIGVGYTVQGITVVSIVQFIKTGYLWAGLTVGVAIPLLTVLLAKVRRLGSPQLEQHTMQTAGLKDWLKGLQGSFSLNKKTWMTVILIILMIGFVDYYVFVKGFIWLQNSKYMKFFG